MPGIPMDGVTTNEAPNELTSSNIKENSTPSEREAPGIAENLPAETHNEPTIEQLFDKVRELESSSDGSESRRSFDSDGEESRIDSELRHLVGAEMEAIRAIEEEEEEEGTINVTEVEENGAKDKNQDSIAKVQSPNASSRSSKKSKRPLHLQSQSESNASTKNSTEKKNSPEKKKNSIRGEAKPLNGTMDSSESGLENPDLGPFYLKHARDLIASDNPRRALKYALRAAKSFEKVSGQKPSLDLAMSLHVTAAIYSKLGKFAEAVPVLQKSIEIPVLEEGQDHALAKFSCCMQLGDTYAMLGHLDSSLRCYSTGLEIQKQTLGDMDPRVGETCRYLAEAHVQALQFDVLVLALSVNHVLIDKGEYCIIYYK